MCATQAGLWEGRSGSCVSLFLPFISLHTEVGGFLTYATFMQTKHIPVLRNEVLRFLEPAPGKVIIDGTVGGGGHAKALAERVTPGGTIIAIDADPRAIERARSLLQEYPNARFYADSYARITTIAHDAGCGSVDGILLDLGLSSDQLTAGDRGFSFVGSVPLDMRFGAAGMTAADVLASASEGELKRIFKEYGDERHSGTIARLICERRRREPIATTDQLVAVIEEGYRGKPRPRSHHMATKVFQALRIAVNDEYGAIRSVLPQAIELLKPGGRLAVISFHSGEDRIVKGLLRAAAKGCTCPPRLPTCVCGGKPRVKLITKKAVVPTALEIKINPRSRSAQLRVIEKL